MPTRPASLGPDTPAEQLRNALMILNAAATRLPSVDPSNAFSEFGYRDADLEAVRRLVATAIGELETDRLQIRRNLDRAEAEIRRLRVAIAAPQPRGLTCRIDRQVNDVLIVVLSDGSVHEYAADGPSDRWRDLPPIPGTRAALLAEATRA